MAAPTLKSSLCQSSSVNSDTYTVTLPAGAVGDLAVCFVAKTSGNIITPPVGWTRDTGDVSNFNIYYSAIFYRILQGGDANPVFSSTQSAAWASSTHLITAGTFDNVTPIDSSTTDNGWRSDSSSTMSALSITTQTDETLVLAVGVNKDATTTLLTSGWTATSPGGCGEPSPTIQVHIATKEQAVASATGNVQWSQSPNNLYLAAITAIKAGGGGGPVTHTGTGALQAGNAAVAGIGTAGGVKTGTGTLQAQDAAVAGIGVGVLEGTGALAAQSASVSGAGAIVQDGTGALQAQDAAVSGIGELGAEKSGSGTLQAQDAAVSGAALRIPVGTGALQALSAAVSGEGITQDLISGTGVLQAQPAAVVGFGEFAFEGVGALQAQSAVVAGTGFLLGELTLTPADLAAIQDAVWAKLVNEGLVGQINELWQRRGLDPAAPQTYDKAGNQIRVGGVTIDLTGDQNAVTQTRQP